MAFTKRKDGIYLKKLPAFRRIFPYLLKTRTESLIYFTEKIIMTKVIQYLKKLNEGKNREDKFTIFHIFLSAVVRILKLRPELNRFVAGRRIYEHNDISLNFIVKKEFTEEADETNARIVFQGSETIIEIREKINTLLNEARSDVKGDDDKLVDLVAALPRPLINFIAWLILALDYNNMLPDFLIKAIPLYASVFLANLGSIGLEAPYHHLFEYGSASIFMVIGKMHKEAIVDENNNIAARDCINVTFTLDERITEGFYCSKSIVLFKKLFENPELLEDSGINSGKDPGLSFRRSIRYKGNSMYEKNPWLKFYGDVPHSITYPDKTMYEMVFDAAMHYPELTAYDFMGTRSTYKKLISDIDNMADALLSRGLKKSDTVTISLPNCPQALILFYALNKIGVVASLIHPLSAPSEIEFYLKESGSKWAVTLNAFYNNFAQILEKTKVSTLLLTKISDYLNPLKSLAFYLSNGRKIKKPPDDDKRILWWDELISEHKAVKYTSTPFTPDECAVILFSGGTTGLPKGIMLSSRNFNSLGLQTASQGPIEPRDTILSILPVFHGFGLGVCVHTFLIKGGKCVLVPRFTPETVANLIKKERPQYMAGVPTLYEALLRSKTMNHISLACLKTAYAGGDKLPQNIKERFDTLIKKQGGSAELLEGYGLTESVTACIVTPKNAYRPGSTGIPLPDMMAKIVVPETTEEAVPGIDGELYIAGPTLMLGYLNSPDVTALTIKKHSDGIKWLHTGDICSMDSDGFVYFKLRMKRIIKVSGVSVSPVQVEEVLDRYPDVSLSCVIGVPDKYKIPEGKSICSS